MSLHAISNDYLTPMKSEERAFLLECIHLYRDLPALWKIRHEGYRDRKLKAECYEILLSKYRQRYPMATKEDLKKKINSLRTNYRKELRKVMDSYRKPGDSSGIFPKIYKSNLWYFEEMFFLREQEMDYTLPHLLKSYFQANVNLDDPTSRNSGNGELLTMQYNVHDKEDFTSRRASTSDMEFEPEDNYMTSDPIKEETICIKEEAEETNDPWSNASPFRIEDTQTMSDASSSSEAPLHIQEEPARSEHEQRGSYSAPIMQRERNHLGSTQENERCEERRLSEQGNCQEKRLYDQENCQEKRLPEQENCQEKRLSEHNHQENGLSADRLQEKNDHPKDLKPENEYGIFDRSIQSQLEELPREDAIELQLLMQTLISGRRLRVLERQTSKKDTIPNVDRSSDKQHIGTSDQQQHQQPDIQYLKRKMVVGNTSNSSNSELDNNSLLVSMCKRLCEPDDEYVQQAKTWATELSKMDKTQQIFAKKGINEILYEGQLGNLSRNSIQINIKPDEDS